LYAHVTKEQRDSAAELMVKPALRACAQNAEQCSSEATNVRTGQPAACAAAQLVAQDRHTKEPRIPTLSRLHELQRELPRLGGVLKAAEPRVGTRSL
jgi:hypothetical protein